MISRTMKKKLLCAVSALAFLTAATAAGTRFVEHRITAAAADAGFQIGKVNADLLTGRIALMDVTTPMTTPMGAARLHVGAIAIHAGPALIGPALAAENVTLNDVSVDAGFATYRIPRIDVTASTLNQQQLLGLFDKNATDPLAKRLAGFSASAIAAPQMYIEQTVQGAKSTVVYKDIAARDIVNGKVGSFTVATAAMSGMAADKPLDGTFGPMSVKDFDLVLMLRLYTDKAGPNDTVPRVIYSSFSAEKIAMTGDKGVKIGIDRISGGGFKARPGQTPSSSMSCRRWPRRATSRSCRRPRRPGLAASSSTCSSPSSSADRVGRALDRGPLLQRQAHRRSRQARRGERRRRRRDTARRSRHIGAGRQGLDRPHVALGLFVQAPLLRG